MIELSTELLKVLPKLKVKSINIESDLYILKDKYLLKKFINDDQKLLKEKERKINYLIKNQIEGTIPILKKVTIDNKFRGFFMPYIKNGIELKEINKLKLNKEEIFKIFIKISKTLELLHQNNIIYGDISESNILIDSKLNPYFIDMDGALVNGIGQCNIPKILFNNNFIEKFNPSKNQDITILNMLFINILSNKKASQLTKKEYLKLIDQMDFNFQTKNYFKQIIKGEQKEYATKYLQMEIQRKEVIK